MGRSQNLLEGVINTKLAWKQILKTPGHYGHWMNKWKSSNLKNMSHSSVGIGSSGVKSGDNRMMNGMGSKRIKDLEMMPCGKCSKSPPTIPHISATTTPKYFPQSTPRHKEFMSCHSWQNLNKSRLLDLEVGDRKFISVLGFSSLVQISKDTFRKNTHTLIILKIILYLRFYTSF